MLIVEMHRIPKPQDGYDLFDCPGPQWTALRRLGEGFGWKPLGTLPASYHGPAKAEAEEKKLAEIRATMPLDWEEQARKMDLEAKQKGKSVFCSEGFNLRMRYSLMDLYEPRDWGGVPRMVSAEDGLAWADALDRALKELEALKIDLPHKGPIIINQNVTEALNESMNQGLTPAFIHDFVEYIRRGNFGFAWDD